MVLNSVVGCGVGECDDEERQKAQTLYLMVSSVVGFYSLRFFGNFTPKKADTTMTKDFTSFTCQIPQEIQKLQSLLQMVIRKHCFGDLHIHHLKSSPQDSYQGAAERTGMERSIVSQGKLFQGQEAGMVEQVCTGQEDCLTGTLAAGSYSCLPAVTMEREWGQADGTLVDLPALTATTENSLFVNLCLHMFGGSAR
ncbi:hypothetical protein U0070_004866 [Myodes glareolus]|uniref:Uncharacterized protein n=1 Tax=Myodes glareolus TaxID=447135 RepID=A0AAW0J5U2_MYOGA